VRSPATKPEALALKNTRRRWLVTALALSLLVGALALPGSGAAPRSEHARVVDQALRDSAKRDPHSAYVEAEKLTLLTDNTHFDAPSAREFGRRYAKAMLQVQMK
jgi:hypothetical protein